MLNSLVMALGVAIGKIAISILSAFAIVYFRFPFRTLAFWMIFITLMLPVEVRIGPTYQVVSNLAMLNTYAGLTVPLIAMTVLAYLPVQLAHDFYHPLAAAANGQCMAFRRAAYAATGGHAAVRGEIVEDVRLAQRVKAAGLKLRMADGAGLVTCRMYGGSKAAIDGLAKSVLAGHGNRSLLLILSTSAHLLLFLWPWLWCNNGQYSFGKSSYILYPSFSKYFSLYR